MSKWYVFNISCVGKVPNIIFTGIKKNKTRLFIIHSFLPYWILRNERGSQFSNALVNDSFACL